MKHPEEFRIPPGEHPDTAQILELIGRSEQNLPAQVATPTSNGAAPTAPSLHLVKGMAEAATEVWRARAKMLDSITGEVREEMRRVHRHVEKALESLREIGLETRDHTGKVFDYGLPLKVIATQPMPDIPQEKVIETIRPTVFWNDQIIQMGEVVIAIPASNEAKA